jgi:hypothetical protein
MTNKEVDSALRLIIHQLGVGSAYATRATFAEAEEGRRALGRKDCKDFRAAMVQMTRICLWIEDRQAGK